MNDRAERLPIWKEKYEKLGVTPRELYMRQNRLCWLKPEAKPGGSVVIHCTDGEDTADTINMLNPTIECVRCMVVFMTQTMEQEIAKDEPREGSNSGSADI